MMVCLFMSNVIVMYGEKCMNRFSLISIALLAVVLGGPMASSFAVTVLSQPDCPSLQIWAEGLIPGETFTPLPGIDLSSLFR